MGGLIELFLILASALWLVTQEPWYVLPYLWDGAYQDPLLLIEKSSSCSGGNMFPLAILWFFTIFPTLYNHK